VEVGGGRRHDRVRIFVRDHGPGIPAEERERIFDPFYRGSTGRHLKGTGIGLAIVRKIARIYQGEAKVEETPGGGATFWVTLVDECTPMLVAGAEDPEEDGQASGRNVPE
jgi:signal transduction histidine kinase